MRMPLDAADGPTRLVRLPMQFDGPSSAPTLATPTCCCCCCCLTTMISTPIVWGSIAADEAHKHNRPKGGAVVTAVFAAPAGLVLGAIGVNALRGGGVLLMLAISVGALMFALTQAGRDAGAALGRSLLIHLVTGVLFVVEFFVGLLLLFGSLDSDGDAPTAWLYGVLILGGLASAILYATRRAAIRRRTPPGLALAPYGMPGTAWPPPSPYGGPTFDPGSMMPPVPPQHWQPQAGPGPSGQPGWAPPPVPSPGVPPVPGPPPAPPGSNSPPPAVLPPSGMPPLIPPDGAPWAPPAGPGPAERPHAPPSFAPEQPGGEAEPGSQE